MISLCTISFSWGLGCNVIGFSWPSFFVFCEIKFGSIAVAM